MTRTLKFLGDKRIKNLKMNKIYTGEANIAADTFKIVDDKGNTKTVSLKHFTSYLK